MSAILGTLAKLIAHEKSARSIGSVQEAEAFAANIQELMFQHKLEMTDVELAEQEKNEPVLGEFFSEEELTGTHRKVQTSQTWVDILVDAVAKANCCRAIGGRRGNSVTIVGRASDRAAAKSLFQYLYASCLEATPEHARKYEYSDQIREDHARYGVTTSTLKRRFTQAFKVGFASGVSERLRSQVVSLRAGAGEQGLTRIDQLAKQVDSEVKNQFPHSSIRSVRCALAMLRYRSALNSTKRLGA